MSDHSNSMSDNGEYVCIKHMFLFEFIWISNIKNKQKYKNWIYHQVLLKSVSIKACASIRMNMVCKELNVQKVIYTLY